MKIRGDAENVRIGARLRKAREEAKLSQAELADRLGYDSATAVSLLEKGVRQVKAEVLQRAAEVLHREVGYFLGQEEPKVDIRFALRADKDLSEKDKEAVMHFIELAKKRRGK